MTARRMTAAGRPQKSGLFRSAVLGGTAGLMALGATFAPLSAATAVMDPAVSVAPMPFAAHVSLAQAGEVTVWGAPGTVDHGQATVPASLAGVAVSQVEVTDGAVLALTAAGTVVGWGQSPARLELVPDAVRAATVAQIATNGADGTYGAAVTAEGAVLTWGLKRSYPTPLDVPAGLTGVTQVSLTDENAVALKSDGSVISWGNPAGGINDVPAGLSATAITTSRTAAFALTGQGTVVAWGGSEGGGLDLPAAVSTPGNVKAVAATVDGAMAILADDTVIAWGDGRLPHDATWAPASVMDAVPASIDGGGSSVLGMVDQDGAFHFWCVSCTGADAQEHAQPGSLAGRPVAQFSVGGNAIAAVVTTKLLRAAPPQVTGIAKVGGVLTGTPGTFSATPDSVQSQWMAGGVEIPGATAPTLTLTAALAGKQITYRSTASKAGEATISSTSTVTTVAALPPVASSTKVLKVTVTKRAAKVTISGKVTASKSPAGRAVVTIRKGNKVIVTRSVGVPSSGAVNLTVTKFAKLVATRTKATGARARTAYKGSYTVTIAYVATSAVKASQAVKAFRIKG